MLQDCSACHHPGNISLGSPLSLSGSCLAHEREVQGHKGLFHSPVPDRGDKPCRYCSFFVEKQLKDVLTVCSSTLSFFLDKGLGIFILK